MISRDSFVKIINNLRDYWDGIENLEKALGIQMDSGLLVDIVDTVIDALDQDTDSTWGTQDEAHWIHYFAFDLDWGRNTYALTGVKIDNIPYELDTAEKLYNLLMEMRKRNG